MPNENGKMTKMTCDQAIEILRAMLVQCIKDAVSNDEACGNMGREQVEKCWAIDKAIGVLEFARDNRLLY